MTAAEVAAAIESQGFTVRPNSTGWLAQCPSHDDTSPSLAITAGSEGRTLIHCHAGCQTVDILDASGLELRDLFIDAPKPWTSAGLRRTGATIGRDGRVVMGGVGYLPGAPSNLKTRAAAGVPRDLWPPPETITTETVLYVVEGEPDAQTAADLGLPAVGIPGTGGWKPEYAERIAAGRDRVVVIADADAPGRDLAARVAADLAGRVADVRVLDLEPGRDDGYDLSDFAAEARNDDERRQVADLVHTAAEMTPPGARPSDPVAPTVNRLEKVDGRYSSHDRRYGARRHDFANLLARADLEPPYRVKPVAVDGHLTVLAALGGDGKTWLGLGMAAGVAHGSSVAGMQCTQGRAVVFDAENGPWVLGSRLKALEEGLPADRVAIYDAEGLRLGDPDDRAWMAAIIREERANLVIIDALRPLAPDAEENSSDSMAPVVIGAKQLARDTGAAVVLIHHRGNDSSRDFRGSTAIRDQADLLFVLERKDGDPDRKWRRRLRCAKCRIAAEPEDRWLGIRGHRGYVTLTEAASPDSNPQAPVREELTDRALAVLRAADGPMSQGAISRALGRGKGDRSVRRALADLGEREEIHVTENGYVWGGGNPGLPPLATPPSPGGGGSPAFKRAADTRWQTPIATPSTEAAS